MPSPHLRQERKWSTGCAAAGVVIFSPLLAAALESARDLQPPGVSILHLQGGEVWGLLLIAVQQIAILYLAGRLRKSRRAGSSVTGACGNALELPSDELLEAVGDAISIQNSDFRVLYQNRAHKELMGSHLGEFCYRAYQEKEEVCGGCPLVEAFRDGNSHRTERQIRAKDGIRSAEIVSTPVRGGDGKITAAIDVVRDISERKRAEAEVQRVTGELEQRAAQLGEANRELEAFSYSLSHDLRSYITRIGTAQQILACGPNPDDSGAAYLLRVIGGACRGMDEMIASMLTLSRLSREEMAWEELCLSDLAREVFWQLRQQEPERRVKFTVTRGLMVRGDRRLLKVALQNLLGNTWKYTAGTPLPRIEMGMEEAGGRNCYFIRDNGVGFDMAEREKLPPPCERLHGAEAFPGTGIGLATVQRAMERHGGEVWAVGEPGKGATFYFTLGSGGA
jgi:PAS domain S-box-containing protein